MCEWFFDAEAAVIAATRGITPHDPCGFLVKLQVYLHAVPTETRSSSGWKIAYWVLLVCWVMGAALNMARVHGGFLTNYLADLTFPPISISPSAAKQPAERTRYAQSSGSANRRSTLPSRSSLSV